jgi:phosphate uptake regulator
MTAILLEDLGGDLALMARLVQSQLMSAMTAFFQKDVALARKVTGKDDQVDNLRDFIEEKCFERIAGEPAVSPASSHGWWATPASRSASSCREPGRSSPPRA